MKNINLQKAILYATGRNLQMGGGSGLSEDDPILVTENHHGNMVSTEHFAYKEIAVLYGWWQAKHGRISHFEDGDKVIEEFVIDYIDDENNPCQTKLYFDITVGFRNAGKTLEQVKTPEELKQIYEGTHYASHESMIAHFYGAFAYARTLRPNEKLNASSLMNLFSDIDEDHANRLISALQDCGFEVT